MLQSSPADTSSDVKPSENNPPVTPQSNDDNDKESKNLESKFVIGKKKKHNWYVPSIIVGLLLITLAVVIISWFTDLFGHFTVYERQPDNTVKLVDKTVHMLGILDVFKYSFSALGERADLIGFLLIIGVFVRLLDESKAMYSGLGRMIIRMKGKEIWIIPILMILISILGSVYGFAEETLALYPILAPLLLAAGFDMITVILVLFLSSTAGVLGSTVNPFAIGTGVSASIAGLSPMGFDTNGLTMGGFVQWRIVLWIISTAIAIGVTTYYAMRVKRNAKYSFCYYVHAQLLEQFDTKSFDPNSVPKFTKARLWIIIVFIFSFVFMVLCSLPYSEWGFQGFENFQNMTKWLASGGNGLNPPGSSDWMFVDDSFVFLIATIVIGIIIMRMKERTFIAMIYDGFKDMISVVVLIMVSNTIVIALDDSNLGQLLVYAFTEGGLDKLSPLAFIVIMFVIYFVLGCIITSTSAMSYLTLPILAPLAFKIGEAATGQDAITGSPDGGTTMVYLTIMTCLFATNLSSLITPTNFLFIFPLGEYKIKFSSYLRSIWLTATLWFVVLMIVLILMTYFMVGA